MGTGPGRTALYQHYQEDCNPPASGWQPARQHNSNPAFAYLTENLEDGTIQLDTEPHLVYNAHPALYIIHPHKFPKFFAGAKDAAFLQEQESEEESESESFNFSNTSLNSSAPSSPFASASASPLASVASPPAPATSTAFTAASQATSNMSSRSEACATGTGTLARTIFDDSGKPIYDEPFPCTSKNSPHLKVQLPTYISEFPGGLNLHMIPMVGMNVRNTTVQVCVDGVTVVIAWPLPKSANSNKVLKALTKGTHDIVGDSGVIGRVQMISEGRTAGGLIDIVGRTHGQQHVAGRTSLAFQSFRFPEPVMAKLAERKIENGICLEGKWELKPVEPSGDGGDVHFVTFSFIYVKSDAGNLNHVNNDDSDIESPQRMASTSSQRVDFARRTNISRSHTKTSSRRSSQPDHEERGRSPSRSSSRSSNHQSRSRHQSLSRRKSSNRQSPGRRRSPSWHGSPSHHQSQSGGSFSGQDRHNGSNTDSRHNHFQSPSHSSGGQHGRGGTSNQSYGRNQSPNNGSYSSHPDQRRATPTRPSRARTPLRATPNRGHSSGSVPDSPSYCDPTPLRANTDNARKNPPFNPDYRGDPSGLNSRVDGSYHESSGHSFHDSNANMNADELGAGSPSVRRSNVNDSRVGSLSFLERNNNHNDHDAYSLPKVGNNRRNNGKVSGVASVASLGNSRHNNNDGEPFIFLRNNHRNNDDDDDDVQSVTRNVRDVQVNLNQDDQEESVRTFVTARGGRHDEGARAEEKNYVSGGSTTAETNTERRTRKPPDRFQY
mmetsp:Transcript_14009/g.30501  ORF Transcript_14009/g.30501 Transcript_14009/m.30501 type:complete len:776 (-) Transcript_14009:393-2720(-)